MSSRPSDRSTTQLTCSPEVRYLILTFYLGVQALNLTPEIEGEGTLWHFMGIYSKNREEWAVADLACARSDVTIIPFYDSLGPEALGLVINQTELTTMCIDKHIFDTLVKLKSTICPSLRNLITFDVVTDE